MVKIRTPLSVKIVFGIVIAVIALIVGFNIYKNVKVSAPISTEEQLYAMVVNNVLKYRSVISFKTTLNPDTIDYNEMFYRIVKADTYIGSEIFRYDYRYTVNGNVCNVKLRISDPAPHRVLLTKLRAKQIASKLEGLSDYEKIKAVHDYIILSNEYRITTARAFNTFYVGVSACNGYAYAFHAIMEELGIQSTCEFGAAHEWNRVMLDGEWYNIDLTWDDMGGTNVSYDYFMKSDADWQGHPFGGATAVKSLEPTGKTAYEYYQMFPNYRLIFAVIAIGVALILVAVFSVIIRKNREKELRRIEAEEYSRYR